MLYITEKTNRADLLSAVYSDLNLIDYFIKAGKDPENMVDNDIRDMIQNWIEGGDECADSRP